MRGLSVATTADCYGIFFCHNCKFYSFGNNCVFVCVVFFFLKGNQARLSSVPQKAELQIKLNPVCCELDISIVDRLNSLLQPQKLTTVEMMASHMYASYNKHISLVSM